MLDFVAIRQRARRVFDGVLCKSLHNKESVGDPARSTWTITTTDLNERSVVYSGGVGGDISFELELERRFGVSVVIFDPSPVAQQTIASCGGLPELSRIEFVPFGLAAASGVVTFAPSAVPGELMMANSDQPNKQSLTCTTIGLEMKRRGHEGLAILKLDIEGFEYQVLDECLSVPIQQICVEFHHFLPSISLWETVRSFRAIRKRGFKLIHKNRYDMTFLHV